MALAEAMTTERKIIAPEFRWTVAGAPDWVLEAAGRCRTLIDDIRVDATALPIHDLVFEASASGVQLIVDMLVPDRDQPEAVVWIHIWRTLICPWDPIKMNGPEYLVRWMRETIANTLSHEVDESIRLRGDRVFDPHGRLS
jgi:hypothetical protein